MFERLKRAIFLRWLRGKVNDWRKQGASSVIGKVWKFLEGWKLVIAFVLLVILKVWDALHNGHTGDFVGSLLAAIGWAPPQWTAPAVGEAAGYVLGLFAIGAKLWVAVKQARAGATPTQLLSTEGAVKLAAAEGVVGDILSKPGITAKLVVLPTKK